MTNLVVSPETLPDILEIWVPVKNYEKEYHVSNMGRVKRISKHTPERLLKPGFNGRGYLSITLSKNDIQKTTLIHKLVATHFLATPKMSSHNQVNHKNGIKHDNLFSNLEWCTASYNTQHAYDMGLIDTSKRKPRSEWIARVKKDRVIKIYVNPYTKPCQEPVKILSNYNLFKVIHAVL